jgi:hypothetical protein
MTPAELLTRLSGVRQAGQGWAANCPAHADRDASLCVARTTGGALTVRCCAGCTAGAILAGIGLTARDLGHPVPATRRGDLAYRPFPVRALPEPIRGFVATGARAIGCDSSYIALPLLVALAAAIGNTRRLELKRGWSAPAIVWGAIVGESGTMKTPAFSLALGPLRGRQQKALDQAAEAARRHGADLARWERDFSNWKRARDGTDPPPKPVPPRPVRFVVADTTVEALAPLLADNPRGLLVARDELAGWIGAFDRYAGRKGGVGADAANWLSMFNAEPVTVDRRTGTPPTIHVPRAAVSVVGGIQPDVLRRALGAEHRESGLAARLLLAWPPARKKRWTEADIDPAQEKQVAELFDKLFELKPEVDGRPQLVILMPEAKEKWKAYFNAHAGEQVDLTGDLAAAWSKLEEYPARLALVVHFVRWAAGDPTLADHTQVDDVSLAAGIVLASWFKHEARRVYAMLTETEEDKGRRQLVEWLQRRGQPVTVREVQQGYRPLKAPGVAEAALQQLVQRGYGTWRKRSSPNGGRPTWEFVLSRPSTSTEPPENTIESEGSVDVDGGDESSVSANGHAPGGRYCGGRNHTEGPGPGPRFRNNPRRGEA